MTRRRQTEQQIQKAVLDHLRWRAPPRVFDIITGG
jgi:hypothetical protein